MTSFKVFDIAGSAMRAQSARLNLVASNLANSESVSSSINQTYRSRQPVFAARLQDAMQAGQNREAAENGDRRIDQAAVGVDVLAVVESQVPPRMEYAPENPLANAQGYIFRPNVNTIEEMTNMIAASRSYQDNVEVANTAKQLMLQTLRLGQ
jgi:flagellar basal-body rod protein FlgC